jgi:signal transduction histidine kinase
MKKNKSFYIILFVLLGFIISNFFLIKFTSDKKKADLRKIQNIQSKIANREFLALASLKKIISWKGNYWDEKFFSENKIQSLSENNKIFFCISNSNDLLFWSDNNFQIPDSISQSLQKTGLLRLNNGWYEQIHIKNGVRLYSAFLLIKYEFNYENDYLSNDYFPGLSGGEARFIFSETPSAFVINDYFGNPLFYLSASADDTTDTATQSVWISIFFIEIALLLLLGFLILKKHRYKRQQQNFLVLLVILLLIILRAILFYFKWPEFIYRTDLFSAVYYASSELLPSIGDLLVNSLLFLFVAYVSYKFITPQKARKKVGRIWPALLSLLIFLFIFSFYFFIQEVIRSLVLDSTIPLELSQLFLINRYSFLALFIISAMLLGFAFVLIVLYRYILIFKPRFWQILTGLFFASLIVYNVSWFSTVNFSATFIIIILICISYYLFKRKGLEKFRFYEVFLYLVLFSLSVFFILNYTNKTKETEKRKYFAQKLASGEDPLAEFLMKDNHDKMLDDNNIKVLLQQKYIDENQIKDYIAQQYLKGYLEKYKAQITVCKTGDSLLLQSTNSKANCFDFFNNVIKETGFETSCQDLYLLNYQTGGNNYVSRLNYVIDSNQYIIVLELNSKFITKGLGYPELLMDKKTMMKTDLSSFSYAKYFNNDLLDAYGSYFYSTRLREGLSLSVNEFTETKEGEYSHLYYRPDKQSVIVISRKIDGFLDVVAPFSVLFLVSGIFLLLFIYLIDKRLQLPILKIDFKNRLQFSILSILLVSFALIGVFTYYFIIRLNEKKNEDILKEKSMSVIIDIQNDLFQLENTNYQSRNELSGLLSKMSDVFFTDINIFDKQGNLVSSSRPQIFSEGLISTKINPLALRQLAVNNRTFFVQKENIGKLTYYSAYVPFFTNSNGPSFYINLPYFARENELNKELSSFLTAFINIYALFMVSSILVILFVSGRITRPLVLIREKIGKLSLSGGNEKILYPRHDEIGDLIAEYNRMIDEIAISAEKLAQSERESAWREMAMQVAHEIKNPLTPMKLSVQYLNKSWKENAADWDQKLDRFSKTMVEQIENLSTIASEFSYFAKMPQPVKENFDLGELLLQTTDIFKNNSDIHISITPFHNEQFKVFADKKQLIRVLNNLLNNAIQAINREDEGEIKIMISRVNTRIILSVKDNGSGIPEDLKDKVFVPSFSTKSEGMGLGLAIVKGIVENSQGKIWFESEKDNGTTFFISLPALD